jgi:hypothetical protein
MNMVKDRPAFPRHAIGDEQLEPLRQYVAQHDLANHIRESLPAAEAECETVAYGADGLAGDLEWLRRKGRV